MGLNDAGTSKQDSKAACTFLALMVLLNLPKPHALTPQAPLVFHGRARCPVMSGGQPSRPYGRSQHLKNHNLKTQGQHLAEHPASDEHREEGQ